jgi:hypothetical protein
MNHEQTNGGEWIFSLQAGPKPSPLFLGHMTARVKRAQSRRHWKRKMYSTSSAEDFHKTFFFQKSGHLKINYKQEI